MPKLNWTQELRKAYQELADGKITPEGLLADAQDAERRPDPSEGRRGIVRDKGERVDDRIEQPLHQGRDGRRTDRGRDSRAVHARRGIASGRHRRRAETSQGFEPRTAARTADRSPPPARQARRPRRRQGRGPVADDGLREPERPLHALHRSRRRAENGEPTSRSLPRRRHPDSPRRGPRRASRRDADQGQPGLQGRHSGRRPDHRDSPGSRQARQAARRRRAARLLHQGNEDRRRGQHHPRRAGVAGHAHRPTRGSNRAEGVQPQAQLRDGRDGPRRPAKGQRRLAVLPR